MYFLGIDLGSSSVKVSLLSGEKGTLIGSAYSPKAEMAIIALQEGWAEQDPTTWWMHLKEALKEVLEKNKVNKQEIKGIGISYQMHGLVVVDKNYEVLRPSIIWCDSRAVAYGEKAFDSIGHQKCLSKHLNSPGNFTASKLKWIKENEPNVFEKIHKIMLPGDFIVMKLTGQINTTVSGLSEGIFWDFQNEEPSKDLLKQFGFDAALLPQLVPTFGRQGQVSTSAALETGLEEGTLITYRAGDQPNNAFSLNVLNPGEVAATAGTSGVVYGVSDEANYDPQSRVNTFAHVNHEKNKKRLGVLLCVNGTGILYNWIRKYIGQGGLNYEELNNLASSAPIGSNQLTFLPFGNGAERILGNKNLKAHLNGLDFNRHTDAHLIRAAKEGIAFALRFGLDIMSEIGVEHSVIKAGMANLFLSPTFRQTLANVTNSSIELFNTDGAKGAARAAGIGYGYYHSFNEAFEGLKRIDLVEPQTDQIEQTVEAYENWKSILTKLSA